MEENEKGGRRSGGRKSGLAQSIQTMSKQAKINHD